MLKVYKVKSYVSINGGDWQRVGYNGHAILDDNPTEITLLDNATFNECYEYITHHSLNGICLDHTLFRKKPIFYIGDSWFEGHRYDHFDTISYKYVYEEWEDVSLNYIMNNFSADKCIQYLKERGISACPILK